MKRLVFILITLFAVQGVLANGPQAKLWKDKVWLIPEMGLSANTMSSVESEANGGFYFGAGLRFGRNVHLATGIYYQGYRLNAQFNTQTPDSSNFQPLNSNYLCFPIQIGFHLINTKLFKFRLAGGAVAYQHINGTVQSTTQLDFAKSLWSMRITAGMEIWRLVFNASYDLGVSDVFVNGLDSKYRALNAGIGFRF
ncbi:MAG: hypothetical protein EP332_07325 [Bacteroidetes bacterium]|nr:MAG: hypothetical protein EP332_07325 [Bacteroidota bacterium]